MKERYVRPADIGPGAWGIPGRDAVEPATTEDKSGSVPVRGEAGILGVAPSTTNVEPTTDTVVPTVPRPSRSERRRMRRERENRSSYFVRKPGL